uniref:Uncharacterized protein n=1 Tax=Aegilops tauschii subsp. strangulata TaxID=200361 RepID=A0A453R8N2_AEGTS
MFAAYIAANHVCLDVWLPTFVLFCNGLVTGLNAYIPADDLRCLACNGCLVPAIEHVLFNPRELITQTGCSCVLRIKFPGVVLLARLSRIQFGEG